MHDDMPYRIHPVFQIYDEIEKTLHVGPPEPGSVREKELQSCCQQMRCKLQDVIDKRRNGQSMESVPFIDALLQSGVPDKQVSKLLFGNS